MNKDSNRHMGRARYIALALATLLSLALAACGQSATASGAHGGATPTQDRQATRSVGTATPNVPTPVPPPYAFPTQWQPAPGAPGSASGLAFAPSNPHVGYLCTSGASGSAAFVYATADGGQSWQPRPATSFGGGSACQVIVDQTNPADVFILTTRVPVNQQGAPTTDVWRSPDGGASWVRLAPITVRGYNVRWGEIGVVGTRLVALVGNSGEGPLPNPLWASDDGGQTWQPIGQNVTVGTQLVLSGTLWVVGTQLITEAMPPCQCGYAAALAHDAARPLGLPLPSQQPPTTFYASADGGTTWKQIAMPAASVQTLTFAQLSGGAYSGLATAFGANGTPPNVLTAFSTTYTSGVWNALPTLVGVEGGYPDPGQLGYGGLVIAPDGSVFADTTHSSGMGSYDAGIFFLWHGDSSRTWQPLVTGYGVTMVQATISPTGSTRLWGLRRSPVSNGSQLVYVDMPA